MYDAVVAIEGGFEPYLIVPGVPPGASPEAAAASAAYGVLVSYFPAQKPALDAAYAATLAGSRTGRGGPRRARRAAGRGRHGCFPHRRRARRPETFDADARSRRVAADAAGVRGSSRRPGWRR